MVFVIWTLRSQWRSVWRTEGEVLLKGACRVKDWIIADTIRIEVEWNLRVAICMYRVLSLVHTLIKAVVGKPGVTFWFVRDRNAVRGIYLRRELGRALLGLHYDSDQ